MGIPHRGATFSRAQGHRPLDATAVIPAGTTITYHGTDGRTHTRTFDYDTLLPADQVWSDGVEMAEWTWTYEAAGWAENG